MSADIAEIARKGEWAVTMIQEWWDEFLSMISITKELAVQPVPNAGICDQSFVYTGATAETQK